MSQFINNNYTSIEQVAGQFLTNQNRVISKSSDGSNAFGEILRNITKQEEVTALKFSKHANERLSSRNIDLTEEQVKRLEIAAKRAGEKGIKESLVMVDDLAFIVNVRSNMVVTALGGGEDKVFTNIDGAVIV